MTLHLITAALLSGAGQFTATGWANDPVITIAACVICGLLINLAGGEIIKENQGENR